MNELDTICTFLREIGIPVREATIEEECFLPGIKLFKGTILYDPSKLLYPGDLLHEAGHIAVTEPALRELIGTDEIPASWPSDGDELVAILWSYAAQQHLGIPLEILFHDNGYKNDAAWLRESLTAKNYIGLPLLEWMGLCVSEANAHDEEPYYPKMKRWLRD